MADRGAIAFGMTRHSAAWLPTMPAMIGHALRRQVSPPHDFKLSFTPFDRGDETQAFEMYAGRFTFAGESISTNPAEAFTKNHGGPDWRQTLFGLGWLKHFAASERALHAQFAICLLHHWQLARKPRFGVLDQAQILRALASHGQNVARRGDEGQRTRYFAIIAAQTKIVLQAKVSTSEEAVSRALALLYAISAVQGLEAAQSLALTLLNDHIDQVILPDGGHVSRDVNRLLDFLQIALPLQQAMQSHNLSAPLRLTRAVERALGLLALLHVQSGAPSAIAKVNEKAFGAQAIFDQAERQGEYPSLAPHAGFARINHAKTSLIADLSTSFMMDLIYDKQNLLLANFGAQEVVRPAEMIDATQGTGLRLISGQKCRTCFLSRDGADLRVEDQGVEHPVVLSVAQGMKLSPLQDGHAIMLVTQQRDVWHLTWRGADAQIRQAGGQQQIVINPNGSVVNWSLKKQAKAQRQPRRKTDLEPDLL